MEGLKSHRLQPEDIAIGFGGNGKVFPIRIVIRFFEKIQGAIFGASHLMKLPLTIERLKPGRITQEANARSGNPPQQSLNFASNPHHIFPQNLVQILYQEIRISLVKAHGRLDFQDIVKWPISAHENATFAHAIGEIGGLWGCRR